MSSKKVMLIIRDGWGYRTSCHKNAVCKADTPFTDQIMDKYPNSLLEASGGAVGLPSGVVGNSEVGHITIGAGRIVESSLSRINKSISDGSFFKNEVLLDLIESAIKLKKTLHLISLIQDEGVHSHNNHLFSILKLCKEKGLEKVLLHLITDGRDGAIDKGLVYIKDIKNRLKSTVGKIVTISGRYYAMDRNNNWDRTERAYQSIVNGESEIVFEDPTETLKDSYDDQVTDEFIIPRVKIDYNGFDDNDFVLFTNFRTDRTRQLTKAIIESSFSNFDREKKSINFVAMTKYYDGMMSPVLFKDIIVEDTLGQIISSKGLKQLRISETEKYPHVTFFFNAQKESALIGEDRVLVDSPRVKKYNSTPEMSSVELADSVCKQIDDDKYSLIVLNFVNCDMVGHTGDYEATIKAVEAVDSQTEKVVKEALNNNYDILVFADHGNAEDQSGNLRTTHTTNKVPCIFISDHQDFSNSKIRDGGLRDIAPTVLELLGIAVPEGMTGKSLIIR